MTSLITDKESILILQFKPVGDVLLTSPVAEYIKRQYPNTKIYFLCYEHFLPLIKNNKFIDEYITLKYNKKKSLKQQILYLKERCNLILKLRKLKIDIGLDYIGLPSSAWLLFFGAIKYRVGYADLRGRRYLYNIKAKKTIAGTYTVEKKYNFIKAIGMQIDNPILDTNLLLDEAEEKFAADYFEQNGFNDKFTVIMSPDSPRPFKRWSMEQYSLLAKKLIEKYAAKILLLHGPGEKDYVDKLHDLIGEGSYVLPNTSIMQAAAIIKKSSLIIVNCSGVKHISVALKTPSVTIFGKTTASAWHPMHLPWATYIQGDYLKDPQNFDVDWTMVMGKVETLIEKGYVESAISSKL